MCRRVSRSDLASNAVAANPIAHVKSYATNPRRGCPVSGLTYLAVSHLLGSKSHGPGSVSPSWQHAGVSAARGRERA